VSAVNHLIAFYAINGRKGEMLFFCSVSVTTRDTFFNLHWQVKNIKLQTKKFQLDQKNPKILPFSNHNSTFKRTTTDTKVYILLITIWTLSDGFKGYVVNPLRDEVPLNNRLARIKRAMGHPFLCKHGVGCAL
jgi:hypothetical protein